MDRRGLSTVVSESRRRLDVGVPVRSTKAATASLILIGEGAGAVAAAIRWVAEVLDEICDGAE